MGTRLGNVYLRSQLRNLWILSSGSNISLVDTSPLVNFMKLNGPQLFAITALVVYVAPVVAAPLHDSTRV